jgi:hypothetical protein
MATAMKLAEIWRSDWKWLDLTIYRGEIVLADDIHSDYECEEIHDEACALADLDPEDPDNGPQKIERVADRHDLLKPGDYAVVSGFGGDVVYLRKTEIA